MKTLKWLDEHLEEAILVVLLVLISCIELIQVIFRNLSFVDALTWPEEFCRFAWIWSVFISLPFTIRKASMLRVSVLVDMLPQAVRNIMPSIGNEFVVNIKDSSVLNVISVGELFFMSNSAAGAYLRYFEVFFITACIYLALTFTVTRLLRLLEKRMDGKKNYTIYGSQSDSQASITISEEEAGV